MSKPFVSKQNSKLSFEVAALQLRTDEKLACDSKKEK